MVMERSGTLSANAIVREARRWIGTPYHHQASVRGAGTDCLGLVRGVWRAVMGSEAETPPPYTRDWGEVDARETLREAAERHLATVMISDAQPGDVLLFRMRAGAIAKHMAILATPLTMIHATEGAEVAEVAYGPWWRRRVVAVFRFPMSDEAPKE